jgi:hypothetical protein
MEQLMALNIEPGDQDSAIKSLAGLKSELAEEKAGRAKAQTEAKTLAQAVEDLKKTTDRFAAQIDNKVLDGFTKANKDYKRQNAWLT